MVVSYTGDALARVKPKNRERIQAAEKSGSVKVMMQSKIKKIETDSMTIVDKDGKQFDLPNEVVVVCVGGIRPTGFLKEVGIQVEARYGT